MDSSYTLRHRHRSCTYIRGGVEVRDSNLDLLVNPLKFSLRRIRLGLQFARRAPAYLLLHPSCPTYRPPKSDQARVVTLGRGSTTRITTSFYQAPTTEQYPVQATTHFRFDHSIDPWNYLECPFCRDTCIRTPELLDRLPACHRPLPSTLASFSEWERLNGSVLDSIPELVRGTDEPLPPWNRRPGYWENPPLRRQPLFRCRPQCPAHTRPLDPQQPSSPLARPASLGTPPPTQETASPSPHPSLPELIVLPSRIDSPHPPPAYRPRTPPTPVVHRRTRTGDAETPRNRLERIVGETRRLQRRGALLDVTREEPGVQDEQPHVSDWSLDPTPPALADYRRNISTRITRAENSRVEFTAPPPPPVPPVLTHFRAHLSTPERVQEAWVGFHTRFSALLTPRQDHLAHAVPSGHPSCRYCQGLVADQLIAEFLRGTPPFPNARTIVSDYDEQEHDAGFAGEHGIEDQVPNQEGPDSEEEYINGLYGLQGTNETVIHTARLLVQYTRGRAQRAVQFRRRLAFGIVGTICICALLASIFTTLSIWIRSLFL